MADEFEEELEQLKNDFREIAYRSWKNSNTDESFYKGVVQGLEMAKQKYKNTKSD